MKKRAKELAQTGLMIAGLLAFRSSFADQYVIPSGSMEPTIEIGDHVAVNKMAYGIRLPFTEHELLHLDEPRRGDIIVFQSTEDPSINLIKRLVGLPGDRIEIVDGLLKVNGEEVATSIGFAEIHAKLDAQSAFEYQEDLGPAHRHRIQRLPDMFRREERSFVVPAGKYFFMGDNRDNSRDSRWFGFVPYQNLRGRAHHVFYSVQWRDWFPSLSRFGMEIS